MRRPPPRGGTPRQRRDPCLVQVEHEADLARRKPNAAARLQPPRRGGEIDAGRADDADGDIPMPGPAPEPGRPGEAEESGQQGQDVDSRVEMRCVVMRWWSSDRMIPGSIAPLILTDTLPASVRIGGE